MKPDIHLVLQEHAKRLSETILPKLTGFEANGAAMMSAMLVMIAEEWDRAAARRVEENAALRVLFIQALPLVREPALAAQLKVLAEGSDTDLRVSALDDSNNRLRAALSEVQAHLEKQESPAAEAVLDEIWRELRLSVERRALSSANF